MGTDLTKVIVAYRNFANVPHYLVQTGANFAIYEINTRTMITV